MADPTTTTIPIAADDGLMRTVKDLIAGAAGGVTQVMVGQPFDIVKVRMQTQTQATNALDVASRIWREEGPLAFYKVGGDLLKGGLRRGDYAEGNWD